MKITTKVPICSRIGPKKVPILPESPFFPYYNIFQHKVPMAKVCNAATALHINQYNSIASIVHTHNNWHTKHDLHLHHMSVTLSTTMSFILSASMSVINHYVRHRVARVYKCHIMMRSHTMLKFFFSPLYEKLLLWFHFKQIQCYVFFAPPATCHLATCHLEPEMRKLWASGVSLKRALKM